MRKFKLAGGKLFTCIVAWVMAHVWSGCTNIKDDTRRTKVEGTAVGVAGGALVGGLIGAFVGMGSPASIVEGALSGGASGGYQGHAYGSRVADKKKQYASNEAYLDACIGELEDETRQCREYNAREKKFIDREERQLAAMGSNQKNDEVMKQHVETNVKSVAVSLEHWEKVIEAHKRVVEKNRGAGQEAKLSAELQTLETQTKELHASEQRLLVIKQQLPK